MSRQYKKRKTKKASRRIKEDTRQLDAINSSGTLDELEESMAKIVSAGGGYTPQEGDSVTHIHHTSYGVGRVMSTTSNTGSASVYWPCNDHTTVQGFHVLRKNEPKWADSRVKAVGIDVTNRRVEEEPMLRGRRTRSKAENASMREDRYAFSVGDRVLHEHHKVFGSGRVLRRRTFGNNEYRWDIRWNDGRTRTHGADYLISLDINPARSDKKQVEQTKHSDPNRGFRAHKSNRRVFGRVIKEAARCAECEAVLPHGGYGDPGDPRRWCHDCYRQRRTERGHSIAPSLRSSNPSTSKQRQMATTKQLCVLAELSQMKGINSNIDMQGLGSGVASVLINAWQALPDITPPAGPYTISNTQKTVIRDLERRLEAIEVYEGIDPIAPVTLDSMSSEEASRVISEFQYLHDEAQ